MAKKLDKRYFKYQNELRAKFLHSDISVNGKLVRNSVLIKEFSNFYNLIKENNEIEILKEILYCILLDIKSIPSCKNEKCSNEHTRLRNFQKGFQNFCCVDCQNEWQRNSKDFAKNISKGLNKFIAEKKETSEDEFIKFLYTYKYTQTPNYYVLYNYCEHQPKLKIYSTLAKNLFNEGGLNKFCIKCNKKTFETYNPSDEEIEDFQKIFPTFYKEHSLAMKRDWWLQHYPKEFKILNVYYERYFGKVKKIIQREVYYVFLNNLKERPKCKHKGCQNPTRFSRVNSFKYNVFCESHSVGYNASGVELEMEEFLQTLNIPFKRNDQSVIHGELDFYYPEKNLAIEFNGLWFHCDRFKDKDYHKKKYLECKENGIQLISIWEDDWNIKKEIVQSMIKSKLGLYETKIGARECEIKKDIDFSIIKDFTKRNHLQGHINYSEAYGLYYKDKLVSIITLGPSRFKKGELELLRFCSEREYQVIGGFSKLIRQFKKDNPGKELITYANCDISNGNVYKVVGFEEIGYTENWSWLEKGKRVNRFSKELRARAKNKEDIPKCYTCGTLKLILK